VLRQSQSAGAGVSVWHRSGRIAATARRPVPGRAGAPAEL